MKIDKDQLKNSPKNIKMLHIVDVGAYTANVVYITPSWKTSVFFLPLLSQKYKIIEVQTIYT